MAHQPDITSDVARLSRQAHGHAVLQAAHECGALNNLRRRVHNGMTGTDVHCLIDETVVGIEARAGVAVSA